MAKYNGSRFSIHRANKNKTGVASTFNLSKKPEGDVMLFLEVAKQIGEDKNGNAIFAWRNGKNAVDNGSVTLKLGTADIGELLAVISGRKTGLGQVGGKYAGLFHQNAKGSSTMDFKLYEKDGSSCFSMSASNKIGDKEAVRLGHMVSFGESESLRVFLEQALVRMNNWDMKESGQVAPEAPVQQPEHDPLDNGDITY